jgi:hypothetical protein
LQSADRPPSLRSVGRSPLNAQSFGRQAEARMVERWDETWHRLQEWTSGQGPSERLAAQVLLAEGFTDVDPSHPLGERDGGKDGVCRRDGIRLAMAVYFPRGRQGFSAIKAKFFADLAGAKENDVSGIAFVTNQELTLSQREELTDGAGDVKVELFHIERVTAIPEGVNEDETARLGIYCRFSSVNGGSALGGLIQTAVG